MAEHSQRIEDALVAYLQTLTTFSGSPLIHAGESDDDKTTAVLVARIDGDMENEDPAYSNNRWCNAVIELRTPISEDDSTDWLAQHKLNAAALEDAILDDGFESGISNASLYVYKAIDRVPIREQAADYWMSGYRFRLYSGLLN